jgi:4-amino-4-deoxy-L-arabinose transferase-like glycosyltransferase
VLAFVRLGLPLQEPQESRYAEIPRQMLAEGKWLAPVLHGEPYLDKPPLLYWLVMASYSVFGVHDWAARIVPCTAALLTMLVTYLWSRRVLGPRGGFLAGMMLCLSIRYVYLARMLTMDTLLCLFVVAALAGAHLAMRGPVFCWRPWIGSALACGLGLLTKGPVALVLVAVPIWVSDISSSVENLSPTSPKRERGTDHPRSRFGLVPLRSAPFLARLLTQPRWGAWLIYGSVATGVALPWYVAVMAINPEFAEYFFWKHHVERFVTPFDHQEPFWFYLPGIFLGMLPWTLLVPGMIRSIIAGSAWPGPSLRSPGASRAGSSKTQPWPRDLLVLSLVAFAWCVLFFSLSGCKRPGYVLPAMPLLALALACFLDTRLPAGGAFGGLGHRGLLFGTTTFALLLVGLHQILPGYARRFSMRGQVRPHAAECADAGVRVASYPRRWDSVSFYLGRNDVRAYAPNERRQLIADLTAAPRTLLFLKSEQALEELLRELPPALRFVRSGRQGTVSVGFVGPREHGVGPSYARR